MLCLSGFELYSRWVPLKRQTGDYARGVSLHREIMQTKDLRKNKRFELQKVKTSRLFGQDDRPVPTIYPIHYKHKH